MGRKPEDEIVKPHNLVSTKYDGKSCMVPCLENLCNCGLYEKQNLINVIKHRQPAKS
jgi:hypothetical protein